MDYRGLFWEQDKEFSKNVNKHSELWKNEKFLTCANARQKRNKCKNHIKSMRLKTKGTFIMIKTNQSKAVHHRDSGMELLRIVSMFLIVIHHFAIYTTSPNSFSMAKAWLDLLRAGGQVGVNIFVLISGYYLILDNGSLFKFNKFIKIFAQISFYAIGIFTFFCLTNNRYTSSFVNKSTMLHFIYPLQWWFVCVYLALYLIHPYLNILLKSLSRQQYQQVLLMFFLFFYIFSSFGFFYGTGLTRFIFLYMISGYIQLHKKSFKLCTFSVSRLFAWTVVLYAILFIIDIFGVLLNKIHLYSFCTNTVNLLVAVLIFTAFTKITIRYNRWINIVASATFGVYLIHESRIMHTFLWEDFFKNSFLVESKIFIYYSILASLFVYLNCTAIDLLRRYFAEHFIEKWFKPYEMILESFKNRCCSFLRNLIFFEKP